MAKKTPGLSVVPLVSPVACADVILREGTRENLGVGRFLYRMFQKQGEPKRTHWSVEAEPFGVFGRLWLFGSTDAPETAEERIEQAITREVARRNHGRT